MIKLAINRNKILIIKVRGCGVIEKNTDPLFMRKDEGSH
jgi:hypothetical protein